MASTRPAAGQRRTSIRERAAPQPSKRDRVVKGYAVAGLLALAIFLIFLFGYLYSYGLLSVTSYEALATISLSISLPLIAISYMIYKCGSFRQVFTDLGLGRDRLTPKNIMIGVMLFLAILLLEIGLYAFQQLTHIQLPTNVAEIYAGFPVWFFILTFTLIPIDEEILFRGFMVPRIGIVLAALIFAILHLSYLSISEFVAAFVYALLAGYVFKRTNSLYTTIIAHALVNALAVSMFLSIIL